MESMCTRFRPMADTVGILSSGLCAVHCVLLPVSVVAGAVGPFSGLAGIANESVHFALIQIAAHAAALALSIGFRHHRDRIIAVLGAVGVALLLAAATGPHTSTGDIGEKLASVGAAGFLISAHIRNRRLCRSSMCAGD